MAELMKVVGRHFDIPFVEGDRVASAAAAGGNDYEVVVCTVPDLTLGMSAGLGDIAYNGICIRSVMITPEAAITGAATNYYAWNVRQYRGGNLVKQVNTTCASSISTGAQTLTPASMTGIQVNSILYVSAGTGTAEYVLVTAVTATTFTATFANTHSGAYTIVSYNIASVSYATSSITEAAYTPRTFPNATATGQMFIAGVAVKPGDVLTFQRQAFGNGLTGGSPAAMVQLEYVSLINTGTRG